MRRTSAIGNRPATAGFTLVEILAVIAITGIILAVAAVNLFPDAAQLSRREAANLALDMEHARDTAWFGGLPTSVTIGEGRVRKWRLAGSSWEHDPARDRRLDNDVRIVAMHVDGVPLEPGERLVFLPDGLGVPFRIALEVGGQAWAIEGDMAGAVKLEKR